MLHTYAFRLPIRSASALKSTAIKKDTSKKAAAAAEAREKQDHIISEGSSKE